MNQLSDLNLIELAKKGDQGAFRALYERYEPKIFNYVAKFLGNPEIAEEVTQSTFVIVFKNLQKYRPVENASPWIFKIAANLARRAYGTGRREAERTLSIDQTVSSAEMEDQKSIGDYLKTQEMDPREILRQKEFHEHVQNVLNALPARYREIIVLHDIEEASYDEITRILQIPYNVAAKRLSRARLLFRKRIDPNQLGIEFFILWVRMKETFSFLSRNTEKLLMSDATVCLLIDGQLPEDKANRIRCFIQENANLRQSLRLMEEAKVILKNTPRLYPAPELKIQTLDLIFQEPLVTPSPFMIPVLQFMDQMTEGIRVTPRPVLGLVLGLILSLTSTFYIMGQESKSIPFAMEVKGRPKQEDQIVRKGDKIRLHQLIKTGPKEELFIERPKLLTINLKENTTLTIEQISYLSGLLGDHKINLHEGTFFFKSEPNLAKGDFKVLTPWFVATNQGTVSSFTLNPDMLRIAVLSGRIELNATLELKPEFPKPILVSEGEEFIYDIKNKKIIHRPISEESLKGLADFSSAEEVVLLGLPPKGRAGALVGKGQAFAFVVFNVQDQKLQKQIDEVIKLFEPSAADKIALKKAIDRLKDIESEFRSKRSNAVAVKLMLIEAAISDNIGDYDGALNRLKQVATDPNAGPELQSIALCAQGIIDEERLKDSAQARHAYEAVLKFKPDTSVTEEARTRLGELNRSTENRVLRTEK